MRLLHSPLTLNLADPTPATLTASTAYDAYHPASAPSTPPCTPPISSLYFNPFTAKLGAGAGGSSHVMSRHSSLSSMCSSNGNEDEHVQVPWTDAEQAELREVR